MKNTVKKDTKGSKMHAKLPVDRLLSRRCMIRFCKQYTKPGRMSREFYTAVRESMMKYIAEIVQITCDNAKLDKKFSCLPRHCPLTDNVHTYASCVTPNDTDTAIADSAESTDRGGTTEEEAVAE